MHLVPLDSRTAVVYLIVIAAMILGGILGYRRSHKVVTIFVGPALGIGLVVIANVWISDGPTPVGVLPWRIEIRTDAIGFVVVYLVAFVLAAAAGTILRQSRGLPKSADPLQ